MHWGTSSPLEDEQIPSLIYVDLTSSDGCAKFRRVVPDKNHRIQLLHHIATYEVESAFYTVASPTTLIYTVWVRDRYRLCARGLLRALISMKDEFLGFWTMEMRDLSPYQQSAGT